MAHPKRRGRSDADIGDAGVDQQEQDREVEVEGFEHPLVDDDDRGPERKKNGVKKRGFKRGKKKGGEKEERNTPGTVMGAPHSSRDVSGFQKARRFQT